MRRKELVYYVTWGSNVTRYVHWCVTVFYQQIKNSNIANQIHGFTIDCGKFILTRDRNKNGSLGEPEMLWAQEPPCECFHSFFEFSQTSIFATLRIFTLAGKKRLVLAWPLVTGFYCVWCDVFFILLLLLCSFFDGWKTKWTKQRRTNTWSAKT